MSAIESGAAASTVVPMLPPSESAAVHLISAEFARGHDLVPLRYHAGTKRLIVAVAHDGDESLLRELLHLPGVDSVEFWVVPKARGRTARDVIDAIIARHNELYPERPEAKTVRSGNVTLEDALNAGVELGSHDIEIYEGRHAGRVIFTVDGRRVDWERSLTPVAANELIHALRTKAKCDTNDADTQPADGSMTLDFGGQKVYARVNTIPTFLGRETPGYCAVVRLVGNRPPYRLFGRGPGCIGLTDEMAKRWTDMCRRKRLNGVVGWFGEGKTTLWNATVAYLNDGQRRIRTLEQPVESIQDGIVQTEITEGVAPTFGAMIRGYTRQSIDMIGVGELRDDDTILATVLAGTMGLLVLFTTHSFSTAMAPIRLTVGREKIVEREALALSMNGLILPKLFWKLCASCSTSESDSRAYKLVREAGFPTNEMRTRRAGGCAHCVDGFSGRVAAFELLEFTEAVATAFVDRKPLSMISAGDQLWKPVSHDALRLASEGIIDVATIEYELGPLK